MWFFRHVTRHAVAVLRKRFRFRFVYRNRSCNGGLLTLYITRRWSDCTAVVNTRLDRKKERTPKTMNKKVQNKQAIMKDEKKGTA